MRNVALLAIVTRVTSLFIRAIRRQHPVSYIPGATLPCSAWRCARRRRVRFRDRASRFTQTVHVRTRRHRRRRCRYCRRRHRHRRLRVRK